MKESVVYFYFAISWNFAHFIGDNKWVMKKKNSFLVNFRKFLSTKNALILDQKNELQYEDEKKNSDSRMRRRKKKTEKFRKWNFLSFFFHLLHCCREGMIMSLHAGPLAQQIHNFSRCWNCNSFFFCYTFFPPLALSHFYY